MDFLRSLAHPFTIYNGSEGPPKIIDDKFQVRTEIATAVAGVFTLGIAAVPVFYGVSAYYRWKCHKHVQNIPFTPYIHNRGELMNILVDASKVNPDTSLEPFKDDLNHFFNFDILTTEQLDKLKPIAKNYVESNPQSRSVWQPLLETQSGSLTLEQSANLLTVVEEHLKQNPQDKPTWDFLFERLTPRQWDTLIQVVEKYLTSNPIDRATWENLIDIKFKSSSDCINFQKGESPGKKNLMPSLPISLLSAQGSVFRDLFAEAQRGNEKPSIKVPLELQGIKITDAAIVVFSFLLKEGLKCNVDEQLSFFETHPLKLKDNLAINLLADYYDVQWIHGVLPEMYEDLQYVESIEDLIDCMKLSAILMPEEIDYDSKDLRFGINRETAQQFAEAIQSNHKLKYLNLTCCKFDGEGLEIMKEAIIAAKNKQPELEAHLKIGDKPMHLLSGSENKEFISLL